MGTVRTRHAPAWLPASRGQRIVLRLVDLVDVSSLTSDGQCPGSRSLSEGAHVLASPRADSAHGRSTERHASGSRHPLGAVPRLGSRGARPRDPMKTPRAKEGEAPPTVPSNVSWGRRSRKSPEWRSHLGRDSGATPPGRRSWRHSTAWKDALNWIPHSSQGCAGSRSLGLSRAGRRPAGDPPPNRKAAPPSRFTSFGRREASRWRADWPYKTSRTFTATMNAKTTRSGLIGTRSVWDRTFERMLPDSSAWALVSSRMIRKRMRAATAAAPKLPARNVDVTVTTVVIMRCAFPSNKVAGLSLYINTSPTGARFDHQS